MNVYYKSKFTGIEIDQRLAQGTYDDAVKAGFTGTKEEFDQLTWAFGKEQQELLKTAQQQRADNLETESKNIVEAINEVNAKSNNSATQSQLTTEVKKLNETIATVNDNLVTSINTLNKNMFDGFNTIDGGIENEIKPEIDKKQDIQDENLLTVDKTIVGAINEILPKATGVGRVDPNSDGTGEIFNSYVDDDSFTANQATGRFAHAEGVNNVASDYYCHVEGVNNVASSPADHAEGQGCKASGNSSHAEGFYCTTTNQAEHAEGKYNLSHYNFEVEALKTRHSVGIGTDSSNRKNAHEIMTNGDHYVYGIGGYEGTEIKSVTNDIKTLQDVINTQDKDITSIKSAGYQTSEDVDNRINEIIGAAPEALDTLKEIADALNNDPDFAATITNELSKKVDKVDGKQLSTEDYTTAEKEKLAGLENYDDSNILNQLQQTETGVAENLAEIEKLQSKKQDVLVSGENIKTINGESLLGEGDIQVKYPFPSEDATHFSNIYIDLSLENLSNEGVKLEKGVDIVKWSNNGETEFYRIVDLYFADHYYWITAELLGNSNIKLIGHFNLSTTKNITRTDTKFFQKHTDQTLNTTDKTVPGAINELKTSIDTNTSKFPVYTIVPELTENYEIPLNDTTREYIYEIPIGATKYNITAADGIKWQDDFAPLITENKTYIVSVIRNLAVWGEF